VIDRGSNSKLVGVGRSLTLEEVVLEAAPGHVLVDEHPLLVLAAVPDELHQMRVAQHPQVHHLRQPLAVPLRPVGVEVLHGHVLRRELPGAEPLVEEALVDGAEPALADEVAAGEVARRGPELRQGEGVQARGGQRPRQVVRRQRPQPRRRAPHPPHRLLPRRRHVVPAPGLLRLRAHEAAEQHPHGDYCS
jgi:hypothetical protein